MAEWSDVLTAAQLLPSSKACSSDTAAPAVSPLLTEQAESCGGVPGARPVLLAGTANAACAAARAQTDSAGPQGRTT